ncbi:spore germination protein [Rossellomorea vietnamensis]|uniref:GerAB/ArcD/ProY family transporter n=1 Tax=Rossellomorea vietnamensis TaxID=218284 RepID=UPI001CCF9A83|nr:GerAB/ArcD/ProY family transporter [Rossellomorea vietnamensis]MCA0149660.1 spore germination protein [Rossellomorea vietnamensis]
MDRSLYVSILYLLTHVGLILFLYPANIIMSTTQGHWIPIMIGVSIHFILLSLLLKGISRFPDKDIITIYKTKGKVLTFIFLAPTFIYFLMANIISVRAYSEIVSIVFLSKTPLWAIMALIMTVACYLALKGIEGIIRTGYLIFLLLFPILCFIMIASFQNVDWRYIYPLLPNDFSFLTKASYLKSYFAIGGSFLFLGFIHPLVPFKGRKIMLTGIVLIPIFLLSVYVPVLTFGQATTSHFIFPFVMTVDAIHLTWIMFDRLTVFFLLSIVIFTLLYISLVLWMLERIIRMCLWPSAKSSLLIIGLSIFIYLVCLWIDNWEGVEMLFKWNTTIRFIVILGVPISIYFLGVKERKGENV